jgi:hypothetical protein
MMCQCGCGQPTTISKRNDTAIGVVKGQPRRYLKYHFVKPITKDKAYKQVAGQKRAHRVRAEHALGKPLPLGAVVHHADGSTDEHAPLVICPNDAYHMALHARMRIQAAGGNPWTDKICSGCKAVLPLKDFQKNRRTFSGRAVYCRVCSNARDRARHRLAVAV